MPTRTRFDAATQTLVIEVRGVLTLEDVLSWERDLYDSTVHLPAGAEFRALNDLFGYEVANQDPGVHRIMREVVPRFLALHGFAVGFWRLYDAEPPPPTASTRCSAVAHVHHDAEKMARYNELLATPEERFFVDRGEATDWLMTV